MLIINSTLFAAMEELKILVSNHYPEQWSVGKIQYISAMKITSIGVRGMKLAEGDKLDHAYLLESRMEYQIEYKEKQMVLNKIKLGKRDTKGTKVRV